MKSSVKILAVSATAATTAFLTINFIVYADWIELIVGSLIFLTTYLIVAPITGAINRTDINNLKTMFSGLGIISKFTSIPLKIVEKISEIHL